MVAACYRGQGGARRVRVLSEFPGCRTQGKSYLVASRAMMRLEMRTKVGGEREPSRKRLQSKEKLGV